MDNPKQQIKHKPLISFIVPAHNSAGYLQQTLLSLTKQNIPRDQFEIIVIDNNSTDQTSLIASKLADQLILSPAKTIAAVKNAGAAVSNAQILAFIDADCELSENWAEITLKQLQKDTVIAVGSNCSLPSRQDYIGKLTNLLNRNHLHPESQTNWFLRAFALRRDTFSKLNGFDPKLNTCEDVDLGYRLKCKGQLLALTILNPKHLDDPLSLKDLFYKEYWRGQDSLVIFFKHFLLGKELVYLLMQIWFWLCLLCLLIFVFIPNWPMILFSLLALILPALVLTARISAYSYSLQNRVSLAIYFALFYSARSLVLPRSCLRLAQYYFNK